MSPNTARQTNQTERRQYDEGPPDAGQVIATLDRKKEGEVVVERVQIAIKEFKGNRYIDVRLWTLGRDGKGWFPTAKGTTLRGREIDEVRAALDSAKKVLSGQ